MSDPRVRKFAQILVEYSTNVRPGDRVAVTGTTAAIPAMREIYALTLQRGGYPHMLIDLPEQDELLMANASDEQLDYQYTFHKQAFEDFDVLIKLRSETNTRAMTNVPVERMARRGKTLSQLIAAQMRRGATGELRWMSTLFPTHAYAMEADMGFEQYQDFFFSACYANDPDPVSKWLAVRAEQERLIQRIEGHDRVELRGPNVELSLSIRGRTFKNACGENNLPDGEIYTGPVEDSLNGWVRYTYPAMYQGTIVSGVELKFENGRLVQATAQENQATLLRAIEADPGARYVGEFAIGTNYNINRFTKSILLDEKIGGSFHMALGAGYPETGSKNRSAIHWDMICDMRGDSEIRLDGELIYRDGKFTI
ncbi:MAG: aminopeptidase [Chloroflexota bacterium]